MGKTPQESSVTLVGDVKIALFIFKSFGYLILLIQSETRFHASGFMHVYYYYYSY